MANDCDVIDRFQCASVTRIIQRREFVTSTPGSVCVWITTVAPAVIAVNSASTDTPTVQVSSCTERARFDKNIHYMHNESLAIHVIDDVILCCVACGCMEPGSLTSDCDVSTGQCRCQGNFAGQYCEKCAPGYYQYPDCKGKRL